MSSIKVKIKKLHPDAIIPSYSKIGDAGLDITAISKEVDERGNIVYGTGLSFRLPENHVGLLFPRSSLTKYDIMLGNHVGVLDSQFLGEVKFKFCINGKGIIKEELSSYNIGDRIGQIIIIPYPTIEFEEVEDLGTSERGSGGFGSSGS